MRTTLTLALICLALTACGGSSADPDVTGEGYDGLVTLSAVGAGEQRTLRYDLAEGDTGQAVMTFAMTLSQELDGVPMVNSETVDYSMVIEYEVTAVSAAGDYDVAARFVEIDADPLMRDALAPMMGMEFAQTMSPRGEILDVSFSLPPGFDPALNTMLEQMSDQVDDLAEPLPLEPVGVGATWSHSKTADMGGLESTMVTSYEVTGFDGDLVLLAMSMEVTDFREEMKTPGMPAGVEVLITDYQQTVNGTNELDLSRPFVSSSTATSTMLMKMHVERDGQSLDMEQNMTMEMTVTER